MNLRSRNIYKTLSQKLDTERINSLNCELSKLVSVEYPKYQGNTKEIVMQKIRLLEEIYTLISDNFSFIMNLSEYSDGYKKFICIILEKGIELLRDIDKRIEELSADTVFSKKELKNKKNSLKIITSVIQKCKKIL